MKPLPFPDTNLHQLVKKVTQRSEFQRTFVVEKSPDADFKYMTFRGRDLTLGSNPLEHYHKVMRQRNFLRKHITDHC